MLSKASRNVVDSAKQLYLEKYRESLEAMHFGQFVCIEPVSGQYFPGITLDEAVNIAIDAFPDRLTHTLRVGHSATLHIGAIRREVFHVDDHFHQKPGIRNAARA